MKYFAKYLPIEGNSNSDKWEWNNNVEGTGWEPITPSDMDAVIAHGLQPAPEFRKVKLFLCSRDIQVGDKVTACNGMPFMNYKHEEVIITGKPEEYKGEWEAKYPDGRKYTMLKDREIEIMSVYSPYKVIGEISPEAAWVKEGDEFDEEQVSLFVQPGGMDSETWNLLPIKFMEAAIKEGYNPHIITKIKCSNCGHFH